MNNSIDRDSWTWKLCVRCLLQRKSYQCSLDIRQGSESVIEERLMSSFMDVMKRFHLARSPPPVSLSVYLWASSLCLRNAGGGGGLLWVCQGRHMDSSLKSPLFSRNTHTHTNNHILRTNTSLPLDASLSLSVYALVSHTHFSLCDSTQTQTQTHTHIHTLTHSHTISTFPE